ncbi:MAG: cytochrome c [Pyrinomonadaceae bacterium]
MKILYIRISIFLFTMAFIGIGCGGANSSSRYSIQSSKAYEASLFKQNCVICHGPEGEGRTLGDGRVIPNMREGELKSRSEADLYKQIAEGGNGMLPFRDMLTKREIDLLAKWIHDDLRKQ